MREFSDDIMKAIGKASGEVMAEVGSSDAITKKVYDHYRAFRKNALGWTGRSETGYTRVRSLDYKY